jgi:hypothetical protein
MDRSEDSQPDEQTTAAGQAGSLAGMSRSAKVGIAALIVAGVYVAAIAVFGWRGVFLFMLVMPALLVGGISVLIGLANKANWRMPRLSQHLGILAAIVATVFCCSANRLVSLRAQVVVMATGGQGQLQSWALQVLDEDPSLGVPGDWPHVWQVPVDKWSDQVRRLQPNHVYVADLFANHQRAVRLTYGGGFFHWEIVVGPPGGVIAPKLEDRLPFSQWFRWGDGIYYLTPD